MDELSLLFIYSLASFQFFIFHWMQIKKVHFSEVYDHFCDFDVNESETGFSTK